MQTEKCYEQNSGQTQMEATVLHCQPMERGFGVILDRTCFFPEGGGQPSDRGNLDGIPVTDVQIVGDEIFHYIERPLTVGSKVIGQIDWERRFDLMQQHSGEHIVSGIVHALYGYDNVGFHLGERITVDWDGMLTEAQLRQIEAQANRIIWQDLPVEVTYPDRATLDQLAYRSKKELTGQVRIVTIPGVDRCACCGTHVTRTGEIGLIQLLSVQKFRTGVRVEMLCGQRALEHCQRIVQENHKISVLLSAQEYQTASAVERLMQEVQAGKNRAVELEQRYLQLVAQQYQGAERCLHLESGLSTDSVRRLTVALMEGCDGLCAVFSGTDETGYQYAMGQNSGDLRQLTKEMNQALHGRGGGKPFFVQGAVQATEQEIRAFLEAKE